MKNVNIVSSATMAAFAAIKDGPDFGNPKVYSRPSTAHLPRKYQDRSIYMPREEAVQHEAG